MASSSSAPPQPVNIPAVGEASSSAAPPPVNIPTPKPSSDGESSSAAPPPQPAVNESSPSSPPPPHGKILTLKSSSDDEFQVEESIAVQSGTIKNMVEEGYTVIPLLNVDSETLIKVLEYMMKHAGASEKGEGTNKEELEQFDKEFVNIRFKALSQLVFAANYLHITGLMNLICQTIADKIKNKSVNAVRRIFNITNDYTQEEEDEVRREHDWAHEGEFDDTVFDDDVSEEESEGESDDGDDDDGTSEEGAEVVGGSGNAGEIEEIHE